MTTRESGSVAVPYELANLWGINEDTLLWVRVGCRKVAVHPRITMDSRFALSDGLREALLLPQGITLVHRFDRQSRTLVFGPSVGVLVGTVRKGKRPFGMQTELLQEITRLAEQVPAFVFAFSSQGVDFHRGQIRGLYYVTKQGRWVNSTFPIPDVVYNRIPGRESESRGKVQATIGRLIAVGVKFFNPSYLNKWDCHRWLSQDPSAVPYLPDTRLYKGAGVVEDMLNRYGSVYLKPAQGSLGRGIIRLKKKGGLYEYKYDLRGGTTVGGYTPRLDALEKALYPMLKGKQYIVQQTLNLVQFQGNPFDIRVLMQKGSRGIWQRTKVFARVAQHGSITSNLTGGGSAELIEEVLQQCFGPTYRKRNGVWPKIRDLSRVIPEALEKQMGQNFAELGLDIGIDSDRRVWLIEVNSKPWKSVTTEKGSQDVVERSILRPLLYARWLAGFGSAEGGGEGNG